MGCLGQTLKKGSEADLLQFETAEEVLTDMLLMATNAGSI